MACLSKQSFLKPIALKTVKVFIPECGADAYVYVKELGSFDLLEMQTHYGPNQETSNLAFAYDLLYRVVCDDDGKRIFSSADEVKEYFNLPVAAITRLVEQAMAVSQLDTQAKN